MRAFLVWATAAAGALTLTAACTGEDIVTSPVDGGASSSGTSGTLVQTSSSSSGQTTSSSSSSSSSSSGQTTSSSSSSSGSTPPAPPPVTIPDACLVDGQVAPAGPAPSEVPGDCHHDTCDGASKDGQRTFDANGQACGAEGSVCFRGACIACKPANATSCAAEGGNEPANDSATTATSYSEYSSVCGFSGGSDVDWYTFYADDGAFTNDVFDFDVWSTAPSLEVCIFVKCGGGTSATGCSGGTTGPDGSYGCCWSGAPATLHPHWDLDCAGTSEDSGTTYVSVRAIGGDACEPYLVSGHY